jgi:hypothetical protein
MATGFRKGGGAKVAIKGGRGAATLRKPKGLKADANYKAKSIHSSSNKQGILGKVAQKRETRRIMQEGAKKMGIAPKPARKLLQAKAPANVMGRKFGKISKTSTVTMADSARITKMIGRMDQRKAPKAKAAPKVDTTIEGIARRKRRALADKPAEYLSQKLNTRSAIVRSAANAIYNRQRAGVKQLFGGKSAPNAILKDAIGVMPGLSGNRRQRATANMEAARKRVLRGKKGRR